MFRPQEVYTYANWEESPVDLSLGCVFGEMGYFHS